jgi:hypothetical protein
MCASRKHRAHILPANQARDASGIIEVFQFNTPEIVFFFEEQLYDGGR